ncbi:MAG: MopE-related protein [Planctomycetota bacterium]
MACASFCGDGNCDSTEDQCNCDVDCGTPSSTETNCTDGIDNDCDGSVDAEDVEDCCIPTASREKGRRCSDGVDNDCDGLVDAEDSDCGDGDDTGKPQREKSCSDGVDNDGDGHTDCDDSDCIRNKACR